MIETIFIQIASYRDKELYFTIKNAFENARHPENLFFCVSWQKDDTEKLLEYENHPQVNLIKVPYQESKGACWARNLLQQHYNNEKYTLQLDSHHRFMKHWDSTLIEMYNELQNKGHKKPLITAYLPSYNPEKDPEERVMEPWQINFREKTHDKQILCIPAVIPNFNKLKEPIQAKFYSAHFTFTTGDFVKEVPHDPELYFTGEEMSIGVRAYTFGYDLFHPHKVIAWHEYTRNNRQKHWDDDKEWWKKDKTSKEHYLNIFTHYEKYGIGKERTIEEYIKYSGIDFLNFETNPQETTQTSSFSNHKKLTKECRIWIEESIKLNISKDTIKKHLLDANFDPTHIDYEINFFQ